MNYIENAVNQKLITRFIIYMKIAIHGNNRSMTFPFSLLLSDFSSTFQDVF